MFERIVIPLNGTPHAEAVIPEALKYFHSPNLELDLLTVVDPESTRLATAAPTVTSSGHAAKEYLDRMAHNLEERGIHARVDVRFGPTPAKILEHATQSRASLIAIATRGRSGLGRLVRGSTAESVLRKSPVPLLMIRGGGNLPAAAESARPGGIPRILVPLDGTMEAESILPYARYLCRRVKGRIELLRVIEFIPVLHGDEGVMEGAFDHATLGAGDYLRGMGDRLREDGLEVEQTVVRASPTEGILDRANSGTIHLVAMSTHGRRGIRRLLLGSIVESVLRQLRVPLFTMRLRATVPASDPS